MPGAGPLLDITLTPSGHVVLVEAVGADTSEAAVLPETVVDSLRDVFKRGPHELLLRLATLQDKPVLPPGFAFLATYAPKVLDGGRVQYQPLGRAMEEYAGAKSRKMLVNLLTPVQRAAERCTWVRELVDSGQVFHALA